MHRVQHLLGECRSGWWFGLAGRVLAGTGSAQEAPLPRVSVGARWRYETDSWFKDNNSTARSVVSVVVLAHEKVSVVAGEFDAFKLQATGHFSGRSKGGSGILAGEFTSTYWYAPSVRTIVKSTLTSPYRGTSHVELVKAELQP